MSHHIRSPLSNPISQIDMNDIRLHKIKRGSGLQNLDSNIGVLRSKDLCSKIPSNLSCYQLIIQGMYDM